MKRFALKRITALVLALIMTLSLLPMNVWATEVATDTGAQQLYAGFTENNSTIWNTSVNCPSGDMRGFYLGIKNGETYTIVTSDMIGTDKEYSFSYSDNIGEVEKPDQGNWCAWHTNNAAPAQGYIQLTHNESGIIYQLPVEISYPALFMKVAKENNTVNYYNGTGFGVGGVQEFELYIWAQVGENKPWEYVPITSDDGYTLGCSDEILSDRVAWSTAADKKNVAIIDTRGITLDGEKQVYLTATKDGITYGLRINIYPNGNSGNGGNQGGSDPLEMNGVKIFTSFVDGKFGCDDGDAVPWMQGGPDGPEMVFIPMMPKSGYTPNVVKSVYLVTNNELSLITDNGAVFGNATLTPTDIALQGNFKAYLLQVPGQSAGTAGDVRVKIENSSDELLLHFRAQWNGQDMSCWKSYTTPSGNSIVTVRLTPDQAPLITLPQSINENNELIITVHRAAVNNDAVWNALAMREKGFLLSFGYESIEEEGVAKPQVKTIGTGYTIEKSLELLANENYAFYDYYQGGGGMRGNGVFFAWSMKDTDRTIIVPTEESMTGAWIWRYGSDGSYVDKGDGVRVKLVVDDELGNAVTVEHNDAEYVSADQITELHYPALESVLDFDRTNGALSYADGTLTYRYKGAKTNYGEVTAELRDLAQQHNDTDSDLEILLQNGGETLAYCLLHIAAPAAGYRIQSVATEYNDTNYDRGNAALLWYDWWGPGSEVTYTLTWVDDDSSDGLALATRVQQITIKTPALSSGEKWMDHINDGENHATPVPVDRMVFTQLDADCGAQHQYTPGYMLTVFDNANTDLDIEEILSTTIEVKAPAGAKAYRMNYSSDGNDDPTYNANNAWAAKSFQENVEAAKLVVLADGQTATKVSPLEDPLRKQELGDIEYYYSADRGTRLILLKWIYDLEDENNLANEAGQYPTYEYIQMDTTPYYCILKSALGDVEDDVVVDKPMADVTQVPEGDIYLETRIHPQEEKGGKYGQYFFELRLVDGEGNTYVEYHEDGYTIILPYSFMGEEWNYEMAKNLKEKPIINHYDKNFNLKKNNGAIKGEYTERGIEFVVDSFSPFMLTWDETVKEDTGKFPSGGYYPVVTPTTPVEKPTETKPTTPTQPTTPPAEVTVPVSGDENTINVEASVSGTTATIDKVDMTKLEGVIGDDVAVGTVTIDFSDLESSETIDTVEIPADVVKEIAEAVADPNNDAESLEIILSDGASIEFDAAALAEKAAQAGGADITISIKHAVETILSAAQQAAVGDRVAFDINVTSGGVHISDMGGKITIHAPYELRDGETAEGLVVYYVDDEGNQEKCETSYDSVKKRVNWKTDHLSVYMIAHEASATDDAPAVDNTPADDAAQSDSGNSVGLWIGVALAVLVVAIIVVVILIKRKKA